MTKTQDVHIRQAVDSDALVLPGIERSAARAFRALPDLAWVADDDVLSVERHQALIAGGWSWAASTDVVVGFLAAERMAADVHIWEVAVDSGWQRQGIGRRLLAAVVERARAERCTRLTLTTFTDVAWNEPFYRGLGFERVAPAALDERLRQVIDLEIRAGLPADRRCAMELRVR